jgi:hypothetical protein
MADNIGGKDGSEATFGGRLPWQDRYDRQILGPGRSNGESSKGLGRVKTILRVGRAQD